MGDPRLNGNHLDLARHYRYDLSVDEMLNDRGTVTARSDPEARPPVIPRKPVGRGFPPGGGTYTLVSFPDGHRYSLRVGINAVGRFWENDLVLGRIYVSRRHCVILVHASGGCEVYDTASRNGTWVNGRRVGWADLYPGDVLMLSYQRFLVAWVGPDGELTPAAKGVETVHSGGLSQTR
jgi:pSer/pThr/pTyr-binding forkhead associated (FHA) protein